MPMQSADGFSETYEEAIVTIGTKQPRIWTWMVISGAIVFGVWIVYPYAIERLYPDLAHQGQFGDLFGALNALFAGLAFAGIIWAIILQKNELELQREELTQTRKEIKGQKEQLKAQSQTLEKQNFEESFFQLLRFHNEIAGSLAFRDSTGRGSFVRLNAELSNSFTNDKSAREFEEIWREFADSNYRYVAHYFRHLYNTLEFVDQHSFLRDLEERHRYTNLIRGQLSSDELWFLFYNCLDDVEFKCLIEKYALLEGIDSRILIDPEHKDRYSESAYQFTAA